MLAAAGLTRSFHIADKTIEVLRGVNVSVATGERLFLTGPSGAGKTTLLYVLAGLEKPDTGTVKVGDVDLYSLSKKKQAAVRSAMMGYVFQNYELLPDLTAHENVALPGMIAGRPRRQNQARAANLLEKVGLAHRLTHLPAELSGGEQQRVAIARALGNDPQILFADEPTGNLDAETGHEVISMLLSVVAESKKTLIVVTHDRSLAALGDRELHIADGVLTP